MVPKKRSKPVSASDFLPESLSMRGLRAAAAHCEGCDLFRRATQTVFGEGSVGARLVIVGETPGDEEDIAGHPFVGPAGRLLDDALQAADLDRKKIYVTNAVKHFKWTPRGKRRLHAKPNAREIHACYPWLAAEIEVVKPQLIVCLGATAAQVLLGAAFRVTRQRGKILSGDGSNPVLATYHPSAVLRAPDDNARRIMRTELIRDLRTAAAWIAKNK